MEQDRTFSLAKLRADLSITQQQLAIASGLTLSTVQKIEQGRYDLRNIRLETACALAKVLDIDPRDMIK